MTKTSNTSHGVIIYLTECTLATVEKIAMHSRPKKGELQRQIDIAQVGVKFIMDNDLHAKCRTKEVIESFDGNVGAWSVEQAP